MAFDGTASMQNTASVQRLELIRAQSRGGRPAQAQAMALDLHAAAEREGDQSLAAESAFHVAFCSMMTAQYEQGLRYGHAARRVWQERGCITDQSVTTGVLALLLAWIGEADAITEAEQALTLAQRCGDAQAMVWALQAKCLASVLLKQPQRALPFGEHAVSLSRQLPEPSAWPFLGLAESVVWCSLQTNDRGDAHSPALRAAVERAIGHTREGLVLARRQGDGWLERLFINNVAEYSLYIGDTATADAALVEFADAAGESTNRCRATHLLIHGRNFAAKGRHEEALQAFLSSHEQMAPDDLELATMCQSDLSDTYASLGQLGAALAAHRAFHALFVRRASEAAERHARICFLNWETEQLRETAVQAQVHAANLAASNEQLSREAERLLRASLEDPLTGLFNRRRLEVAFLELLATREPFSLAILDVDRFKQVNDRFSHQVGDLVLRRLGELLTAAVRAQDLVVRYGGEEFAILLRGADADVVGAICERLRRSVEVYPWANLCPDLAVTISIGLAISWEAESQDHLLAIADRRLYCAKQNGRNLLVTAA